MSDSTETAALVEELVGLRNWDHLPALYLEGIIELSPAVLRTAIKLISNSPEKIGIRLYPEYLEGSLRVEYPTTSMLKDDDLKVRITDISTDWGTKFFDKIFSDPVPDLYLDKGPHGRVNLHYMDAEEVKDLIGMLMELRMRVNRDESLAHYRYAETVRNLGTKRVPLVESILDKLYV